jgi:hypothetical protein
MKMDILKTHTENEVKLAVAMQTLNDGFYSNRGLGYLVDKASELSGWPLALYDTTFKVLAASKGLEGRTAFAEQGKPNASFLKAVRIDSLEVARLAVWAGEDSLDELDRLFLVKLCTLLSAQLQRSLVLNLEGDRRPNYILDDLLEGKPVLGDIQSCLPWARTNNLYVMVLAGNGREPIGSKTSPINRVLKNYIPIEQCIIRQSAFVVFLDQTLYNVLFREATSTRMYDCDVCGAKDGGASCRESTDTGASLSTRMSSIVSFRSFLTENELYAGISQTFRDLSESKRQYSNALKAMEIGQKQNIHATFFEDCTLSIITEMLSPRYDVKDLCHPAVLMLLAYDKEHNTDLTNTLKLYLYYATEPTKAANALNIHRNTLFYRIGKIKNMTGITLEYGDEICRLFSSLRFLEANRLLTISQV